MGTAGGGGTENEKGGRWAASKGSRDGRGPPAGIGFRSGVCVRARYFFFLVAASFALVACRAVMSADFL